MRFTFILFIFIISCSGEQVTENPKESKRTSQQNIVKETLFSLLNPETTGIQFVNYNIENEQFNILTYENALNGGGVSVGDLNNDGLPDLYFTGNMVKDALYLNQGNLTFKEITETSGIEHLGYKSGVSMVDINHDGWLDIYICRTGSQNPVERENLVYVNNKNLTFSERGNEFGLNSPSYSNQAYFFDMDNDLDLDMYLVNHRVDFPNAKNLKAKYNSKNELVLDRSVLSDFCSDQLFENKNGQYVDITKSAGIENYTFGLSAAIIDINNDGWNDIYVANDFVFPDQLLINQKNGTFKDESLTSFGLISRNSMGSDLQDINNDGYMDLISLDMMPESNHRQKTLKGPDPYDKFQKMVNLGAHHQVMRNVLQLNDKKGGFQEIGQLCGISHTDWSWSTLMQDFDWNGHQDIYITNGLKRDVTNMDFVDFMSQELAKPNSPNKYTELVNKMPSTKIDNYAFSNNGNLTFSNNSVDWGLNTKGFSQGASYADLDLDGDLDLVVNNMDAYAFVYENRGSNHGNYISVELNGPEQNPFGIGTEVVIHFQDGSQKTQILHLSRGYLSSVEPILYFGLGTQTSIEKMDIIWSNGKMQTIEDIDINKRHTFKYNPSQNHSNLKSNPIYFKETSFQGLSTWTYKENEILDFKRESLLPHKFSNQGPCMTVIDLNKDGLEDLIIGGAKGQSTALYYQQKNGGFTQEKIPAFEVDKAYEDADIVVLDVDQDQDLDIIIISGGAEESKLDDRLYLNEKGHYTAQKLSNIESNGTCVISFDMDGDNDTDLFIGGGVDSGNYPQSSVSYILENEKGTYKVKNILPVNGQIGMIQDGISMDINQDGKDELILCGKWMPIMILSFEDGKMKNQTEAYGLNKTEGAWNSISSLHINQDKYLDIVVGNAGENSFLKASRNKPAVVYSGDFTDNGDIDFITCHYYNDNILHPKHTKNQLQKSMPFVKKKFLKREDYKNATIEDILNEEQLTKAKIHYCYTYKTAAYTFNPTQQKFNKIELPIECQFGAIQAISIMDFNNDGLDDILMAGNEYGMDHEQGISNAIKGICLQNTGQESFDLISHEKSGFYLNADVRFLEKIEVNKSSYILAGCNNDGIVVFKLKS